MKTSYSILLGTLRPCIKEMRAAGINDSMIAAWICDIRAAAIMEERNRTDALRSHNPPDFPRFTDIKAALDEMMPSADA